MRLQLATNTGHMDEYDYLFVGRTLSQGLDWPSHTYIFGWDLTWLIFAWGDTQLGGLEGARAISAVFGVASLLGMYTFVRLLWKNQTAALVSTLLLALEAAHLYSSRLVSYDIVSFTYFIWALPALLLTRQQKPWQLLWMTVASLLLCAAVLSKYTTIMYLPFIAALVLYYSPRMFVLGFIIVAGLLSAYALNHAEQLLTLYNIQISQAHSQNALPSDILLRTARQLLPTITLSLLATIIILKHRLCHPFAIVLLMVFSVPLFAYHLMSGNVISLQKHLLYVSVFLLPLVGIGSDFVIQKTNNKILLASLTLCCLSLFGYYNAKKLDTIVHSYPDVTAVNDYIHNINNTDTILSEDPYLYRYLLFDRIAQSQINETTWFDNNKDGLHEIKDVKQAIWDRKFDYVYLNDQQHPKINVSLRTMLFQRGYQPVLEHGYYLKTMSGEIRTGTLSLYKQAQRTRSANVKTKL